MWKKRGREGEGRFGGIWCMIRSSSSRINVRKYVLTNNYHLFIFVACVAKNGNAWRCTLLIALQDCCFQWIFIVLETIPHIALLFSCLRPFIAPWYSTLASCIITSHVLCVEFFADTERSGHRDTIAIFLSKIVINGNKLLHILSHIIDFVAVTNSPTKICIPYYWKLC